MRAGWEIKPLVEVCTLQRGFDLPKGNRTVGRHPLVSSSGIIDTHSEFMVRGPGVATGRSGSVGSVFYVGEDFWPLNTVLYVKDFHGNDPRFIYYLLTQFDLGKYASGVGVPTLNRNSVHDVNVAIPATLAEQQRIVAVLDEALAGVATATVNAEKNLKNARELFASYLNSAFEGNANSWTRRHLGDASLLEIIDGDRGSKYPKQSDFTNSGHCLFLNTKNVRPDGFDFTQTMFISESKDRELRKGKLRRNDVVLTTRGTIGNVAVYDDTVPYENIRINSGMLVFRPQIQTVTPSYLFEFFRSGLMKEQIRKHVSGAAQPQLPIKTLIKFAIPVPNSLKEQESLVSSLNKLAGETSQLKAHYEQRLSSLVELRRSILHQALSGGLNVSSSQFIDEAAE